jgi:hypothetical protein
MPNLITELGPNGFIERCKGALLVLEGDILRVDEMSVDGPNYVSCTNLRPGRASTKRNVQAEVFTSYDVFKTPALGYRKIQDGAFLIRKKLERSHSSGFRADRLIAEPSPMTAFLESMRARPRVRLDNAETIDELLRPKYDSIKDWEQLVSGVKFNLLLSRRWLIEPALRGESRIYEVFFFGSLVGKLRDDMSITVSSPRENHKLLTEILSNEKNQVCT